MASKDSAIQSLSTVEHILKRPGMWIGGTSPIEHDVWILDDNDSISFKKVLYTEGLLKICNEVIDNSIDEGIKTDWKYSNKIKISITKDTFSCEDNGRGIPVEKDAKGDWMCVNAVCKPMSGSNFTDDNRQTIGTNGIGVKGANIFSKEFECITCDGKNKMKIECSDNRANEKHTLLKGNDKTGTKVSFKPDFERFHVKNFDDGIISLIKTRLKFLSWFYPKCQISLNGEKMGMKAKELSQLFPQPSVTVSNDNVLIMVYPAEEQAFLTYVNGISLRDGGSHVEYILGKLIYDIREKVSKKYKAIKPMDIRNRLGIVVLFKGFANCAFNSQTKEELTNAPADTGEFLRNNGISLDELSAKILKTKPIVDNIVDLFRLKEELNERKELAALNKTKKEVKSEKYFPPIAKTGQKFLMITEGQSAFSGISPILGRKGIGYYMLRGKPMNILEKPAAGAKGYMKNLEISELVNILGLDLNGKTEDMRYDYVVVLSDADPDGTSIAGLTLAMMSKLAPKMIEQGRICRLNTPLLIGLKGNKVEEYYFKFPDRKDMKKTLSYFYLKGLGSWTKDRLNQVLDKEGGMEKLLMPFEMDKKALESINNWFGPDATERKKKLRGIEFHINNA